MEAKMTHPPTTAEALKALDRVSDYNPDDKDFDTIRTALSSVPAMKPIPTPSAFWGLCTHHYTNEDLYQAFKARLADEAVLNVWPVEGEKK